MRLAFCLSVTLLVSACSGQVEDEPRPVPAPVGDQAVFAPIDLSVETWDSEFVDTGGVERDPVVGPPIRSHSSIRLEINGGASAKQIPGLRVIVDGEEIEPTGNAAFDQTFTYISERKARARRAVVEIWLGDSRFATAIDPVEASMSSPTSAETISAGQPVVVRWNGPTAREVTVEAQVFDEGGTHACAVQYKASGGTVDSATFVPQSAAGRAPPCIGVARAVWASDEVVATSPFKSLTISRTAGEVRRFDLR